MQVGPRVDDRPDEAAQPGQHRPGMVLAVVVSFLNESKYLPTLLESIEAQTRLPDQLVLVDDGSTDGSYEIAQAFAADHPYAHAVRRPERGPEADRLAKAGEYVAFAWGLERVRSPYDIVVKLDADLALNPRHFAEIVALFEQDPQLGIAGAYLSIRLPDGSTRRERHPADHVRGPNKFYRRECIEQIQPLPDHLGWEAIDEATAHMHGWRTASYALPGGDTIHLRPTGMHDGRLRAFRRWGACAYGWGSHPLNVLAGGVLRFRNRPYIVAGLSYILGWAIACVRRPPRARPEVRAFKRREELLRIRTLDGRLGAERSLTVGASRH